MNTKKPGIVDSPHHDSATFLGRVREVIGVIRGARNRKSGQGSPAMSTPSKTRSNPPGQGRE